MLGFLGLTADVTGFELDPPILALSLFLAVILQLIKDAEQSERGKDLLKQKQMK